MDEPAHKRVAALLRVSTERIEQSESPEAQLLFIKEEIRRHSQGAEVWLDTALVYEDELTGAMVLDRPSVQRLLADAKAKRFDLLAMKSIQRLGRDTLGVLHLKRLLDDLDIELAALQDGYRSSRDPELIFLVHADRAQAGREDISRNVRNAIRQWAKKGRWMSGAVPFGFRRKNRHELEPHPETAPILQEIFRHRRTGWGAGRIVADLNRSGVPAPAWWAAKDRMPTLESCAATDDRYEKRLEDCRRIVDSRPEWAVGSVMKLLVNTAYYGDLRYYRTFKRVKIGGRKIVESRPSEDWITVPCPPLISREEWEEVQEITLRKKRMKERDRAEAHVYLLTGLLWCGRCGARMSGGGGVVGKYGWYGYYHCQTRRQKLTCEQPSPKKETIEAVLLDMLAEVLNQVPEQVIDRERNSDAARIRLQQVETQLADLADEKRYYRNEHRRDRLSDGELDTELARISAAEQPLKAELERVRGQAQLPDVLRQEAERRRELAAQIARWKANPAEADPRQLRTLIQVAVERIVYRDLNDFDLHLRFSQP